MKEFLKYMGLTLFAFLVAGVISTSILIIMEEWGY